MAARLMTSADADWVAEVMAARREVYAAYSPVFWRPRHGVEHEHAEFLRRQLDDPATTAVRTDHGLLIAQRRSDVASVDDFAVEADDLWPMEGRELLTAAWQRLRSETCAMRVVTALADEPKASMLQAAGLDLVEQWWVKPIKATPPNRTAVPGKMHAAGFSGLLGAAPPVYDPGGLVLLVNQTAGTTPPSTVEDEAARLGAVLVVLSRPAGHSQEAPLREHGWAVASQWYFGQPAWRVPFPDPRRNSIKW